MSAASPFSNPAGRAPAAAARYVRALLDLLAERDPLQVMAEQVAALDALVDGVDAERLRTPEAPGKWSMIEVLAHLADTEMVYAWRYRLVLAQDRPPISGFDQDAWAAAFRYRDQAWPGVRERLRVAREANLQLLGTLTADQWERAGLHEERGPETVRRIAQLGAGHDLVHRAQLERIRRCVTG